MLVLLTRDLFFASKVTGTAAALGLAAVSASSLERLQELLDEVAVTGVLIDLGSGVAPEEVMTRLPESTRPRTLAFGAHVDTAALQAAEAAGFAHVMPRSRFSAELPRLLRELASMSSAEETQG
jgi:hypothetical protein